MKRELLANNKKETSNEEDENEEDELKVEEEDNEEEITKNLDDDKDEDIQICFLSDSLENFYRRHVDNFENLLLNKECELKNLIRKKYYKLSEFINFQNNLEEKGFRIFPKESFKV